MSKTVNSYIDFLATGEGRLATAQISELWLKLHTTGKLSKMPVAFPKMKTGEKAHPGDILRVWGSASELEDLKSIVLNSQIAVKHSEVKLVEDWDGKWVEYRRFRVRSRNQKDRTPERVAADARRRHAELQKAETLPFVLMRSYSNHQHYRVMIEPMIFDEGSDFEELDAYGLSSGLRHVRLPLIRG